MLDHLNDRLEGHFDLQYPCDRSSLHLDDILDKVDSIGNENDVQNRLINTLSDGIKALVQRGIPPESRFAISVDSRNSGPVQPDMEALVDERCRWLVEVKRTLVAGPVIKALYNAVASQGPVEAGLREERQTNSNGVDLSGYQGGNAVTLGKIFKIIKYLNAMEQHHLLLSDAVNYVLCVRHPDRLILYIGPPIGNAGLLKLNTPSQDVSATLSIPALPTHRVLGLALALCVIPPNEPMLVGPDAAVFKMLALPPPRMITRSSSGSSSRPKDVPNLGRQLVTIATQVSRRFHPLRIRSRGTSCLAHCNLFSESRRYCAAIASYHRVRQRFFHLAALLGERPDMLYNSIQSQLT